MDELKTVSIQGKPYVEVSERLRYFRASPEFYGWAIVTEVLKDSDELVRMRAIIKNQYGVVVGDGIAEEMKDEKNFVNKSSHVENCQTSAWGRALASVGIGISSQVRSYDEMINALESQESASEEQTKKIYQLLKTCDVSVSMKQQAQMKNEMHTYTPAAATKCIDWLEARQKHPLDQPGLGAKDIEKAVKKAVDLDDSKE